MRFNLILIALITACTVRAANAQDVGIPTMNSYFGEDRQIVGLPQYFTFTIRNTGDVHLAPETVLPFNASYQARSADEKSYLYEEPLQMTIGGNGMAPEEQFLISPATHQFFSMPLFTPLVADTFEVCFWVEMEGDVNPGNNTICRDFYMREYVRDIGIVGSLPEGSETELSIHPLVVLDVENDFGFTLQNFSEEDIASFPVIVNMLVTPEGMSQRPPLPIAATLGDDNPLPSGEAQQFTYVGTPANILLPGAIALFPIEGEYEICYELDIPVQIDPNQSNHLYCQDYFMLYTETLSLPEFDFLADDLTVFPNPSEGEVQFSFDRSYNGGDMQVQIFDLTGRLVHETVQKNAIDNRIVIESGTLESGTYIYHARSASQNFEGKLQIR